MIEIPDADSVECVADWVELTIATNKEQLSKNDVAGAVERNSGSEVADSFLSSVWRELEDRKNLYSRSFYTIFDRTIISAIKSPAPNEYLACLLLSIYGVQGNTQIPGKLFERLTRKAVANYLKGDAIIFGWPFEGLEDSSETAIKQKVKQLANNMGEKFYETPASRFKDRGLDVVGWIPHRDKRSSQLVLLLQCAAGHNWPDKLPVPLDAWCQYIHWANNPVRAFAVPCVISERDWHDISKDKGILFDRIRLMNLLDGGVEDDDLNEGLGSWVYAQL